ncbi:hypothetical protein GCM10023318_09670 [Nocardia callitridis]|uniref:DUF309 domain-containing protein n=1 Tax=Nocardia callitridis TaxID=648753 RepID=A0ABP9JWY0_9NOCA
MPPDETLTFAQQLLDDGLAFNAHEVLEAAWKNGPFAERMLWQGLAQLAVGVTHIQRGNRRGARTLLTRAVFRLTASSDSLQNPDGTDTPQTSDPTAAERPYLAHDPDDDPYGIDRAGLIAYAEGLIAALDDHTEITEDRLRPRLRHRPLG